MKNAFIILLTWMSVNATFGQKVDYKNNTISVDGKELVKINRIKKNFGLTSEFEVYSLSGKKLIIAVVATDFVTPNNDNSFFYYRFTFLTADQVGVFKVNKLGAEKSFVKLIGESNIFANDDVDPMHLKEFIASKSENPPVLVDYTLVNRQYGFPVKLNEDQTISQSGKTIGRFKDISGDPALDTYQISLPGGVVVAKISFTGGNNAQNFDVNTLKDNRHQTIPLHTKDRVMAASTPADRNEIALGRIINWLVDKTYL